MERPVLRTAPEALAEFIAPGAHDHERFKRPGRAMIRLLSGLSGVEVHLPPIGGGGKVGVAGTSGGAELRERPELRRVKVDATVADDFGGSL